MEEIDGMEQLFLRKWHRSVSSLAVANSTTTSAAVTATDAYTV